MKKNEDIGNSLNHFYARNKKWMCMFYIGYYGNILPNNSPNALLGFINEAIMASPSKLDFTLIFFSVALPPISNSMVASNAHSVAIFLYLFLKIRWGLKLYFLQLLLWKPEWILQIYHLYFTLQTFMYFTKRLLLVNIPSRRNISYFF